MRKRYILVVFFLLLGAIVSCSHNTLVVKPYTAGLPENFPIQDVPVVEGQVVDGVGQYDAITKTWSIAIIASGDNILPRAKKRLEDVGFIVQPPDSAPLGPSAQDGVDIVLRFRSAKYMVTISSSTNASVPTVNYQVTQAV